MIKNFLNPEGHENAISDLKVTAILLKGWILPSIGGALARDGMQLTRPSQTHGHADACLRKICLESAQFFFLRRTS